MPFGPGSTRGSGNALTNPYDYGDCTWYVKQRFPDLYGYLGNAGTWGVSGPKRGYSILQTPAPNTVAIWRPTATNGVSPAGHVAVVDNVNPDGSFLVSEMNWNGWNTVDQRVVRNRDGIVGFLLPPGVPMPSNASPSGGACITQVNGPFGWSFCADGLIGGSAMAGGAVIMLGGTFLLAATAMSHTKLGQSAGSAARTMAGPVGKVASIPAARAQARTQRANNDAQTQQQAQAQAQQDAIRRAQVRTARARARVMETRARNVNATAGMSDEDKERAAERKIAATGQRPEPGTVKRRLRVA